MAAWLRGISEHTRWNSGSAFHLALDSDSLDSGNCYYAIQSLKDEQHADAICAL